MYVLGLSAFVTGSSACILKDGEILFAAQEERFTRKKGDSSFPFKALFFCLDYAGISIEEVESVAFYEGGSFDSSRENCASGWVYMENLDPSFEKGSRVLTILRSDLKYRGRIKAVGHHVAHAFGAFLGSPFEKSAIVVVDSPVDLYSSFIACGANRELSFLRALMSPDSLGMLYSAVTDYLGFSMKGDEYKVMGLAAYGSPAYSEEFKKILRVCDDGSYSIDMSFFAPSAGGYVVSDKFVDLFGSKRKTGGSLTRKHKDVAATLQRFMEKALLNLLCKARELTGCDCLCMAGELALNSLANGHVLEKSGFKKIFANTLPDAGGLAIGAAFYAHTKVLSGEKRVSFESPFLGPEFSVQYVRSFLSENGIEYVEFEDDSELVKAAARLIYDGKIVGWFQGRMEWGSRSLGARSILASPFNKRIVRLLNAEVKHREGFRPFAPVVCAEDARYFFAIDDAISLLAEYMLAVCPVHKDKMKVIPAVVHADGSARVQVIRRTSNPVYYDVVKEFGVLSGVPVLINTSFNDSGEPIVCTPEDAFFSMIKTGIDYLFLGRFLVKRQGNVKPQNYQQMPS